MTTTSNFKGLAGYGLCGCGCGTATPPANRSDPRKGTVKGVPVRFIQGHQRRRTPHDYEAEDRGYVTPCWVWQRRLGPDGYGLTDRDGHASAHRWYYEQRYGPIPAGLTLDHLCRVRACVNPAHLEAVTHAVNQQRGSNAKLTPELAEEIRNASGTQRSIASRFGVDQGTVSNIKRGVAWKT